MLIRCPNAFYAFFNIIIFAFNMHNLQKKRKNLSLMMISRSYADKRGALIEDEI